MDNTNRLPTAFRPELSWPDYQPALAEALYSAELAVAYGTEVSLRIGRAAAATYIPGLTGLEATQRDAFVAENPTSKPKFRGGAGPMARKLNGEVIEQLDGSNLANLLLDGQTGERIVDPTLCNIVCLGVKTNLEAATETADPQELAAGMREVFKRATTTITEIFNNDSFRGLANRDTDWRSLFEQLVKGAVFESWQPNVITSVGGSVEMPTVAAVGNILPGLQLTKLLREAGYKSTFTVGFASEFAIDCNGADATTVRNSQQATEQLYRSFITEYYPEIADAVTYEKPNLQDLSEDLPKDYVDFARQCMNNPGLLGESFEKLVTSLLETADKRAADGSSKEKALGYLLSHQLIFRDVQARDKKPQPFVIKVGAPSELRFSQYQQVTTQGYMNASGPSGRAMIPNATALSRDSQPSWRYGQITLYYPSLGTRPPYYKESADEPTIQSLDGQSVADGFEPFLRSLEGSIERYAAFEKSLVRAGIDPSDYLRFALRVGQGVSR